MRGWEKILLIIGIIVLILGAGAWSIRYAAWPQNDGLSLDSEIQACGSIPNGTVTSVVETSRLFINIPKDIYPNVNLAVASNGATANDISNGGRYGYAMGAEEKPTCWSYYFEFDLTSDNKTNSGTVDLSSKSGIRGMPDYLIHVHVAGAASPIITSTTVTTDGIVVGQVLLGPTCPVERIPPDPNCAAKPYATTVGISKNIETPLAFKTIGSNASGTFSVSLPAGEYLFYPQTTSSYPRCGQQLVNVVAGKMNNVIINCDTGIR